MQKMEEMENNQELIYKKKQEQEQYLEDQVYADTDQADPEKEAKQEDEALDDLML